MARFAIKNIKANPFRHIARHPIRREKVEALTESLRTTGFWGNVIARKRDGFAEIAYGHHRLVALKEEFGPDQQVDLLIRDLDDESMLQIMARENMEEWGTSAWVEHETLRAVVEAYAESKINLPKPDPKTRRSQLRYAPSFIPGDDPGPVRDHPYTAQILANFIGWLEPSGRPQEKVYGALAALQYVEEGLLQESDFEGLTTMQAQAVIEQTRKARKQRETIARIHREQADQARRQAEAAERMRRELEKERELKWEEAKAAQDEVRRRKAEADAKKLEEQRRRAEEQKRQAQARERVERRKEQASVREARKSAQTVGQAVSSKLKSGEIGYKRAADVAMTVDKPKPKQPPPYIDDFAKRLASNLGSILEPERDSKIERLEQVIQYRQHLNPIVREDLAKTLHAVAKRAVDYATRLSEEAPKSDRRKLGSGTRELKP